MAISSARRALSPSCWRLVSEARHLLPRSGHASLLIWPPRMHRDESELDVLEGDAGREGGEAGRVAAAAPSGPVAVVGRRAASSERCSSLTSRWPAIAGGGSGRSGGGVGSEASVLSRASGGTTGTTGALPVDSVWRRGGRLEEPRQTG